MPVGIPVYGLTDFISTPVSHRFSVFPAICELGVHSKVRREGAGSGRETSCCQMDQSEGVRSRA